MQMSLLQLFLPYYRYIEFRSFDMIMHYCHDVDLTQLLKIEISRKLHLSWRMEMKSLDPFKAAEQDLVEWSLTVVGR